MADTKPYRALVDIDVATGVRAFNKGEVVHDDLVKANGWEHLVSREGTKAADTAVTEAASA